VLTAKIDTATLRRSIKRAVKAVGETGEQATARWGVECCRGLAKQTQVWGSPSKIPPKQIGAIESDAKNVVMVINNPRPNDKRILKSARDVYDWVELNRTRRRGRTAKLDVRDKKICTQSVFDAACKMRIAKAGEAKGGWIRAGMEIASRYLTLDRVKIGKGFIPWAARHASRNIGTGTMKGGWSPTAMLENIVRYSNDKNVLSLKLAQRAILWAGKNVLKRYEKVLENRLKRA
jgi:hypothetical protein